MVLLTFSSSFPRSQRVLRGTQILREVSKRSLLASSNASGFPLEGIPCSRFTSADGIFHGFLALAPKILAFPESSLGRSLKLPGYRIPGAFCNLFHGALGEGSLVEPFWERDALALLRRSQRGIVPLAFCDHRSQLLQQHLDRPPN